METTIEKAAERLAQLRRAGVEVPSFEASAVGGSASERDDCATISDPAADARHSTRDGASPEVVIDFARLAGAGMITPDDLQSQIADEFRLIKRPLLDNVRASSRSPEQRANLIMITSALAGEGKTFVAVNLALSIAMEMDYRVLLVEADARRPSVLSTLGLPASRGLIDVLVDPGVRLGDVLLRTSLPRLSVLPVGSHHARAAELLSSQSMTVLARELSSRYSDRIIIFDTPPILSSAEARALAMHVGQIVVVVAAGSTSNSALRHALETLESRPTVMTMLNKVTGSSQAYAREEYGGRPARATQA